MNKYMGSIQVLDDQGNSVFERELSYDEIIHEFLAKGGMGSVSVSSAKRVDPLEKLFVAKPKDVLNGPGARASNADNRSRSEARPCCGSMGARHKKNCQREGKPGKGVSDDEDRILPKAGSTFGKRISLNEPKAKLPPPPPVDHGRVLTEFEYDSVRELKDRHGMTSMKILAQLPDDCTLQQVNWAMLCNTFDAYIEHTEKLR